MKQYKVLMAVLAFSLLCNAQQKQSAVQTSLGSVDKDGFYAVPLSPALSVHAKAGWEDIRIHDGKGKQVPYLLQPANRIPALTSFQPFEIIERKNDTAFTTLVVRNPAGVGTDQLYLQIANNAVERFASVSGSTDGNQWYIVQEQIPLQSQSSPTGHFLQSIRFPPVDYPYLKLVIRNGASDPLNILQAGIFTNRIAFAESAMVRNPAPVIQQKDSTDGNSYLLLKQPARYRTDRIELAIKSPRFYHRRVDIIGTGDSHSLLAAGELSSDRPAYFQVPSGKAAEYRIVIYNGDNPPLQIDSVFTSQVRHYAVAFLERGGSYTLSAGDSTLSAPAYDLSYFRDSVPSFPQTVSYGSLVTISQEKTPESGGHPVMIWIAIAGGVTALGFLTFRMMREMK